MIHYTYAYVNLLQTACVYALPIVAPKAPNLPSVCFAGSM